MHYLSYGWRSMRQWLQQPLGQYLLKGLNNNLTPLLSKVYGYRMLLMGEPEFFKTVNTSFIKNKILLHPYPEVVDSFASISSRLDMLSIACDSIDVVYLPHSLELVQNPHEVLREAYRVLAPEGHLIVAGFNPFSLWGIIRVFARFTNKAPWILNTVGVPKLKDWLALLGFDIDKTSYYGFNLPINNTSYLKKTIGFDSVISQLDLPICNCYIVTAQKRVLPLTPIKPRFKTVRNFNPAGVVETSKIKY